MLEGAISNPVAWPQPPELEEAGVAERARVRILLAEDTPISAQMMEAMARRLGVDLDIAANGAEAIALIRSAAASEQPYTLLLLDVMMPVLDGVETARRLRTLGFDEKALPIIAVTAATDLEDLRTYREAGMQAFLSKPVNLADLGAALSAWGQGSALARTRPQDERWAALRGQFALRKRMTLEQIELTLSAGQPDEDQITAVRILLHQLAGTAGSFGENDLSERARELEAALVSEYLQCGDVRQVLAQACECLRESQ